MKAHILATGPSMSAELADRIYVDKCESGDVVIAVNDAVFLAPWADAICAQDVAWWQHHSRPLAEFKGQKFSSNKIGGATPVDCPIDGTGMNSGGFGIFVACKYFAARDIYLHGFDMQGTHFFGPHTGRCLKNTDPTRRKTFQWQFAELRKYLEARGVRVHNLTPNSALEAFPWEP